MRVLLALCVLLGCVSVAMAQGSVKPEDLILPPNLATGDPQHYTGPDFEAMPPETPIAVVNGETIAAEQLKNRVGALSRAIENTLIDQAVRKSVSVYDPQYIQAYRQALRARVAFLYLDDVMEHHIAENSLEGEFERWLEGYRSNIGASHPVSFILRRSKEEVQALIHWVKRGYDFADTRDQYSQLEELLVSSPIRDRIEEKMELLRQELGATMKPGDISPAPIKTPFGWVLAYKFPFEVDFTARVQALRQQFFRRNLERFKFEIVTKGAKAIHLKHKALPAFKGKKIPWGKKIRNRVLAFVQNQENQFSITYGQVLDEFYKSALNNLGHNPRVQMQRIYANMTSDMVIYELAKDTFTEQHPKVRTYMDGVSDTIRRDIFFDRAIAGFSDIKQIISQSYGEAKSQYKQHYAIQLKELAASTVNEILDLIARWKSGVPFKVLAKEAIYAQNMKEFFISQYVVVRDVWPPVDFDEEDKIDPQEGALLPPKPVYRYEYAYEVDLSRYGTELLRMRVGDISLTPVFHAGQWGAYKMLNNVPGFLPTKEVLRQSIIKGLHFKARRRILEGLKKDAKIEILIEEGKKDH